MEEVKSSVRPFSNQQQHRQKLGNTKHYRLNLMSTNRRRTVAGPALGQDVSDAYFDISAMFPSPQTDLLNGEWEIFLESFSGHFAQFTNLGFKVCLPDLIKSSHSYVGIERNNVSLAVMDDSVAYVPLNYQILSIENPANNIIVANLLRCGLLCVAGGLIIAIKPSVGCRAVLLRPWCTRAVGTP